MDLSFNRVVVLGEICEKIHGLCVRENIKSISIESQQSTTPRSVKRDSKSYSTGFVKWTWPVHVFGTVQCKFR